jgi:hypothetical protein
VEGVLIADITTNGLHQFVIAQVAVLFQNEGTDSEVHWRIRSGRQVTAV